jgi:hypothetical protein
MMVCALAGLALPQAFTQSVSTQSVSTQSEPITEAPAAFDGKSNALSTTEPEAALEASRSANSTARRRPGPVFNAQACVEWLSRR